ncbi:MULTISPECIES: hypothetical protein [Glycomyces]|uniref:WxL domain-containing protein n=2 Tax=Glycomyces TaxID=58113 RepID=A0A9X3SY26_9ACTN|nr:hypothetical protein [Glycomyces lechevalierae]MDA1385756.1 hypothetical protein [Glycomyces lechevalierae]MDR7339876.1 hypothetical protein [Glycomyces lechevalierae]
MNRGMAKRVTVAAFGGVMLAGVAGAAFAEEQVGTGSDVDVNVTIEDIDPGVLAMSVAGTTTTLAENGSTETVRQFTGDLPTVTVTDTRTAEEIPDGAFWWVEGTASSFVGDAGQAPIGAENLGWSPSLVDDGSGAVAVGPDVAPALDTAEAPNNVGLQGRELLAMALTSDEAIGSWEAGATLTLQVPADVEPGSYSSTITLSLFE